MRQSPDRTATWVRLEPLVLTAFTLRSTMSSSRARSILHRCQRQRVIFTARAYEMRQKARLEQRYNCTYTKLRGDVFTCACRAGKKDLHSIKYNCGVKLARAFARECIEARQKVEVRRHFANPLFLVDRIISIVSVIRV